MSATDRPFVVLPTYNEKENIVEIISAIFSQDKRIQIIVVDDSSPDQTAKLVENLKKKYAEKLHLIIRKKRGRGSAVLKGFTEAIKKNATCVVEMDVDFSHNPADIPRFLEAQTDFQTVIGSRFVSGGRIEHRNWFRNFLSFLINRMIRLLLGLKVKDASGGFRCYPIEVLKKIDFQQLLSHHYSLCPELLYCIDRAGFPIKEIPITFVNRKAGRSKANLKIACDYFLTLFKIRFSRDR